MIGGDPRWRKKNGVAGNGGLYYSAAHIVMVSFLRDVVDNMAL